MIENCLYSRLDSDVVKKIEAELKKYPVTTQGLIDVLKSNVTFANSPYGQVYRLCEIAGVSLDSPWDTISEW